MFSYDEVLSGVVQTEPDSIPDVLRIMQSIDTTCADGDGLKWFNWLYLQVTTAVEAKVNAGGFSDAAWLAELDVQFARLYFTALRTCLTSDAAPACWLTLFQNRNRPMLTRIQLALAGINAHINHDLPEALVSSGEMSGQRYADYTALNSTLDSLIELAKKTLLVRLLGEPLPPISKAEDAVASWSVGVARETAWRNAEILSHLGHAPPLAASFMNTLDVLTTAGNKALLVVIG